ncbi:MAG: response regulator [Terriglobia bacterium]
MLVDDHELVRKGLRFILEQNPQYEICGEAGNGREAIEKARELAPDVVILDISMPELNGLEAAREIRTAAPRVEILALTVSDSEQLAQQLLSAGVRGYLLKSDAARDLAAGVESLLQRRPFFTSKIARMVLQGYLDSLANADQPKALSAQLTSRERQIIQLLAEGKSSKDVAIILGITVKTAETHRANIMRKLDLHSISDLVRFAIRNEITEP